MYVFLEVSLLCPMHSLALCAREQGEGQRDKLITSARTAKSICMQLGAKFREGSVSKPTQYMSSNNINNNNNNDNYIASLMQELQLKVLYKEQESKRTGYQASRKHLLCKNVEHRECL